MFLDRMPLVQTNGRLFDDRKTGGDNRVFYIKNPQTIVWGSIFNPDMLQPIYGFRFLHPPTFVY